MDGFGNLAYGAGIVTDVALTGAAIKATRGLMKGVKARRKGKRKAKRKVAKA